MRRHALSISLFVLALSGGAASGAWPQAQELAVRGPRFVAAWKPSGEAVDVSNAVVLRRRVSLDLTNVTADEALKEITRQADLEISYSKALLPASRSVSLHAREITVAAALTEVLLDAGVDVAVARGGHMALVKRPASALAEVQAVDTGAVSGRVTDKATEAPIVGATVVIEGTQHAGTTDPDGRYRITDVPAGTYGIRARYIGYAPLVASVTVSISADAVANFVLEKSVQQLEDVVTTGTFVPTEVKALPTPVTVITAEDIGDRRAYDLGEVIREAIPTAISRRPVVGSPTTTFFSVRGATSLAATGGRMKVFVDGLESADRLNGGVDPSSIERVEIIRGPQGAAIYGSDAIGGVIQIFTKRGSSDLPGPRLGVEGAWGLVQGPYDRYETALRQTYRASAQGGMANASYQFGASYEHSNPHVPQGEHSNGGVSGGVRITRGVMNVDFSGRYFVYTTPLVFNPELAQSGFFDFAAPYYQSYQEQDQALGAHLSLTPRSWWQHSVTMGVDRRNTDMAQTQPRRTFPEDTLLSVYNANQTRTSVAYNTSVHGPLGPNVSGVLTAGVDYYRLPSTEFSNFGGLLTTEGTLQPAPDNAIFASRGITTNSGYFAQTQLGFQDALFLTAGLRAEQNSNFGDSLGTPLSPRVGLSYVQQVSGLTLKLRSAWGRAIKPPGFGAKVGAQSALAVRLANPSLGPERQQGWDGGIDAVFGSRGALSVTYYDQRAENLIDFVTLTTTPTRTTQFQNVGRVRNTGLELEGTLALGPARLTAQYGYSRARVEQLAPGYAGDQRVGAQVLGLPKHTAGATVNVDVLPGTNLSAGLSYVGGWENYDWVAFYRCLGETGPCRNETFALGDYLTMYPSSVKVNATVSRQFTPFVSGFVRVENLTNNDASEFTNDADVIGRITTVGVRFGN